MTGDRSDLYAVLGLTPHTAQEQIRHAYRTLLRQNHPDTRPLGARYDRRTSQQTTTPTPVRPAWLFTLDDPDQPPIQASFATKPSARMAADRRTVIGRSETGREQAASTHRRPMAS